MKRMTHIHIDAHTMTTVGPVHQGVIIENKKIVRIYEQLVRYNNTFCMCYLPAACLLCSPILPYIGSRDTPDIVA